MYIMCAFVYLYNVMHVLFLCIIIRMYMYMCALCVFYVCMGVLMCTYSAYVYFS